MPKLKLLCVVPGIPGGNGFSVDIDNTETVSDLKKEIKKKTAPKLDAFAADSLTLYKINVDVSDDNHYQRIIDEIFGGAYEFKPKDKLFSSQPIFEFFQQSSKLAIEVLVELPPAPPPIPVQPPKGVKRSASETPEPDTPSKRQKADHEAGVKIAKEKPHPSSAAHIMNLRHVQHRDPILIARPHSTRGPPVTIYEPTFAHFRHNLRTRKHRELGIPPDYYRTVSSFLVTSCGIYRSDLERREALLPILMYLLGQPIMSGKFVEDSCNSDGICTAKVVLRGTGVYALLMLWKVKNEIGTGCDPSTQASFSFTRWWSDNLLPSGWYSLGLNASFLLSIAGPWVSVHGGIQLGKDWIIQPLTNFMWTGTGPNIEQDDQVARVAQLFYCLRTALKDLESRYMALGSIQQVPLPCFPYITSYGEEPNGTKITYKRRLHCSDMQKATAIFAAEDSDGTPLFIKFTSRYNETAHRLLAREGYAPILRHCSETIAGSGCFMVVMDQIDGENMFGQHFTEDDLRRVRRATDLLHQHNIVFGDLRPNNIIKPEDGSGVKLVDFDWCALAGEGKYPLTVNSDSSCGWHPEVGPGVLMRKEHDDHLYERLHSTG